MNVVRGILTGKFKRDDKDFLTTLAGTRLGWTNEKPEERARGATPYIEEYRENEDFWTLQELLDTIGKAHGNTYWEKGWERRARARMDDN